MSFRIWHSSGPLPAERLRVFFSVFGPCEVRVPTDPATGLSKGFGFTAFESEAAMAACLAGRSYVLDGIRFAVERSTSEPRRGAPGGGSGGSGGGGGGGGGGRGGVTPAPAEGYEPLPYSPTREATDATLRARAAAAPPPQPPQQPPGGSYAPPYPRAAPGAAPSPPRASHAPPGARHGNGPRMYVGGVPLSVSPEAVADHFRALPGVSAVLDVYFPTDKDTGVRKPFGFVTFDSPASASAALASSNRMVNGVHIGPLNVAAERAEHYGGDRGRPRGGAAPGPPGQGFVPPPQFPMMPFPGPTGGFVPSPFPMPLLPQLYPPFGGMGSPPAYGLPQQLPPQGMSGGYAPHLGGYAPPPPQQQQQPVPYSYPGSAVMPPQQQPPHPHSRPGAQPPQQQQGGGYAPQRGTPHGAYAYRPY